MNKKKKNAGSVKEPAKLKKVMSGLTVFMVIVFMMGAAGLDSENILIPAIMIMISVIWFILVGVASNRGGKNGKMAKSRRSL